MRPKCDVKCLMSFSQLIGRVRKNAYLQYAQVNPRIRPLTSPGRMRAVFCTVTFKTPFLSRFFSKALNRYNVPIFAWRECERCLSISFTRHATLGDVALKTVSGNEHPSANLYRRERPIDVYPSPKSRTRTEAHLDTFFDCVVLLVVYRYTTSGKL